MLADLTAASEGLERSTTRLREIDIAKGIGILLVVFGHIVAVRSTGPANYAVLKTYIYQFHMPFFMFLSGVTFFYSSRKYSAQSLAEYAYARGERLLVPFVVFGLLITIGKTCAEVLTRVDDPAGNLVEGVYHLFVDTNESPALSIWYLLCLFVFSSVTFALIRKIDATVIFLGAFLLYFINFPDVIYLDRIMTYYTFFIAGILFVCHYDTAVEWIKSHIVLILLFTFMASCVAIYVNQNTKLLMLMTSIGAIPLLYWASLVAPDSISPIFSYLGRHSLSIYLFNTIVIGVAKAGYGAVFGSINTMFLLYAVLATLAGLLAPILISEILFRVMPSVSRYTR